VTAFVRTERANACLFALPEKTLSFPPAILTRRPRSSCELFRGHGSEMTRVLMQSVAEFLDHLHGLSVGGSRRFCAQLTDPVFESAAGHHECKYGNACTRVDFSPFRTAERIQKNLRQVLLAKLLGNTASARFRRPCLCTDFRECQHRTRMTLLYSRASETLWSTTHEF
jgi:hypothetical protein